MGREICDRCGVFSYPCTSDAEEAECGNATPLRRGFALDNILEPTAVAEYLLHQTRYKEGEEAEVLRRAATIIRGY